MNFDKRLAENFYLCYAGDMNEKENDFMYLKCNCGEYKHVFADKVHMDQCSNHNARPGKGIMNENQLKNDLQELFQEYRRFFANHLYSDDYNVMFEKFIRFNPYVYKFLDKYKQKEKNEDQTSEADTDPNRVQCPKCESGQKTERIEKS